MERKALNSLGYMELAAFFVFGTFLLGLYYDIVWLQWVTANYVSLFGYGIRIAYDSLNS